MMPHDIRTIVTQRGLCWFVPSLRGKLCSALYPLTQLATSMFKHDNVVKYRKGQCPGLVPACIINFSLSKNSTCNFEWV